MTEAFPQQNCMYTTPCGAVSTNQQMAMTPVTISNSLFIGKQKSTLCNCRTQQSLTVISRPEPNNLASPADLQLRSQSGSNYDHGKRERRMEQPQCQRKRRIEGFLLGVLNLRLDLLLSGAEDPDGLEVF